MRIRILTILFALTVILVAGCGGGKPLPSVEILHARFGTLAKSPDGKISFTDTNTIPIKEGQGRDYGWMLYLRTNKPSIKVNETIKLSGPSEWGMSEKPEVVSVISPDKTSASVDRVRSGNLERIYGAWSVSKEDPPGPASITVKIEGSVEHKFAFTLAK